MADFLYLICLYFLNNVQACVIRDRHHYFLVRRALQTGPRDFLGISASGGCGGGGAAAGLWERPPGLWGPCSSNWWSSTHIACEVS